MVNDSECSVFVQKHRGFTTDEDHDFNTELTCSICLNLLQSPQVHRACGHMFCTSCIHALVPDPTTKQPRCPQCLDDMSPGSTEEPPRQFEKLMALISVRCRECDMTCSQSQTVHHVRDVCKRTCMHKCSEMERFTLREWTLHVSLGKCPTAPGECKASDAGCPWKGLASDAAVHNATCAFAVVRPVILTLKRKLDDTQELLRLTTDGAKRSKEAIVFSKTSLNLLTQPQKRLSFTADRRGWFMKPAVFRDVPTAPTDLDHFGTFHASLREAPSCVIGVSVNSSFQPKEVVQTKLNYCGLSCLLTVNWVNYGGKLEVSLQVLGSDAPLLPQVNCLHVFIKPWHAVYGFNATTGGYFSGSIETFVSESRKLFDIGADDVSLVRHLVQQPPAGTAAAGGAGGVGGSVAGGAAAASKSHVIMFLIRIAVTDKEKKASSATSAEKKQIHIL